MIQTPCLRDIVSSHHSSMEDYQSGEHFWNFLTRPKSKASYEETEVESDIDTRIHNNFEVDKETYEVEDGVDTGFYNDLECITAAEEEIAIRVAQVPRFRQDHQSQGMVTDHSCIEVPPVYHTYSDEVPRDMSAADHQDLSDESYNTEEPIDFGPFVKATVEGNWSDMREFINSHHEAVTAKMFHNDGTALHYTLHLGKDREKIAECLVERMEPKELETEDKEGYTPLAIAAHHHHPRWLLQLMLTKNSNLPNIGKVHRIPVAIASWKGFKDTTRFLYELTDKRLMSPDHDKIEDTDFVLGIYLLHDCIIAKIFDIASDLVEIYPKLLLQPYDYVDEVKSYPIHAFAKTFSTFPRKGNGADKEERAEMCGSNKFLRLIGRHLSEVDDIEKLKTVAGEGMIEAAKHGNIEFIIEMLKVDWGLIDRAEKDGKNIFWYAVENRQEKVFNLIYAFGDHKDSLLSYVNEKKNNILHCAAMLPRSSILDRTLGPALQMQRELQWFQELSKVAKTRYRGDLNEDGLTPRQLFTKKHKSLLNAAETSMKDTAKAASTVAALIVATVFSAAFAVVNGNKPITSNSSSATELLLNIFVICDTLSLCSSTTTILVFLGILTSRYSEEDFLIHLPRKFMTGFCALFVSIATMMMAFCFALVIMLDGRFQLVILLVSVLLFVLVMFRLSSIYPLLATTYYSTYGPSIFDKATKLPESKRASIRCCDGDERR